MTVRTRLHIGDASVPALPGYVRLHYCTVRQAWAVLAPERVYWPDETSLAILRLCDGTTSAGGISAKLAEDYDAPLGDVQPDVLEFLQEWSDRRLLIAAESGEGQA